MGKKIKVMVFEFCFLLWLGQLCQKTEANEPVLGQEKSGQLQTILPSVDKSATRFYPLRQYGLFLGPARLYERYDWDANKPVNPIQNDITKKPEE